MDTNSWTCSSIPSQIPRPAALYQWEYCRLALAELPCKQKNRIL